MDYIQMAGLPIPYPNDFTMEKVPNRVAEIKTLSGRTIADINGWKYANTTLKWDTLLDSDLQNLLTAISDDTFTFTFKDIDNQTYTIEAELESRVNTKTRYKRNGDIVWKDVNVTISFPDCYH